LRRGSKKKTHRPILLELRLSMLCSYMCSGGIKFDGFGRHDTSPSMDWHTQTLCHHTTSKIYRSVLYRHIRGSTANTTNRWCESTGTSRINVGETWKLYLGVLYLRSIQWDNCRRFCCNFRASVIIGLSNYPIEFRNSSLNPTFDDRISQDSNDLLVTSHCRTLIFIKPLHSPL
jgi:hypothetical protein